jgi:hypothetical protein
MSVFILWKTNSSSVGSRIGVENVPPGIVTGRRNHATERDSWKSMFVLDIVFTSVNTKCDREN